jgi:hypothetical protein
MRIMRTLDKDRSALVDRQFSGFEARNEIFLLGREFTEMRKCTQRAF